MRGKPGSTRKFTVRCESSSSTEIEIQVGSEKTETFTPSRSAHASTSDSSRCAGAPASWRMRASCARKRSASGRPLGRRAAVGGGAGARDRPRVADGVSELRARQRLPIAGL